MKIDREKLRKVAEIELRCEYEDDFAPEGSFDDKRDAAWAREQVANGNEWGWCRVEVRAEFAGMVGHDYLGGCSYENEEAFKVPGGYYDDMVNSAIDDLASKLEKSFTAIEALS